MSIEAKSLREYKTVINIASVSWELLGSVLPGELTLNQVRILLELFRAEANQEFVEMRDLVVAIGLSRGAVSRYVATLTERGYANRPGLGLIKRIEGERDRRVKRLSLSPRGVEIAVRLGEALRRGILNNKQSVANYIQEKTELISVMSGVDPQAQLVTYQIRCKYTPAVYRRIYSKMFVLDRFEAHFTEVIDLTQAAGIEHSDQAAQLGIDTIRALPSAVNKRTYFVASDPSTLVVLRRIESLFIDAGLSTIIVCASLSEVKASLNFGEDWEFPELVPLIVG